MGVGVGFAHDGQGMWRGGGRRWCTRGGVVFKGGLVGLGETDD